ncbi:MAG: NHL repeat-containing protein [Deltaproteobacteria bacterium]|nr:NHL repeat-containing protein [Deltaproteobacteria bacterium]
MVSLVVSQTALGQSPKPARNLFLPMLAMSEAIFDQPHDLVLSPDGKRILVADLGHNEIKILDAETLTLLGQFGKEVLDSPHDVAFTRKGLLLVADSGNDRIAIFSLEGLQGTLTGTLQANLDSPEGVSEAPDGRIYVTSTKSNRIVVFHEGKIAAETGQDKDLKEHFNNPHDIHTDHEGRIWVADSGQNRIVELGTDLAVLRILGGPGYSFNAPKYLARDAEGWVYIADEFNNQIRVLDASLRPRARIAGGVNVQNKEFPLEQPEGVTVQGQSLWISDTKHNRILRLKLEDRMR